MPGENDPTSTPTPTPSLMDAPPAADENKAPAADPAAEENNDAVDPAAGDPADGVDDGDGADDGADGDAGEEENAPDGAPDEYTFEAPEGIEIDPEAIEAFKPIAKELNLTQEQAQKIVDVQTQVAQRWQEQVQQHVVDTRLGWREAAQADEEFGGDKFAENLAIAKLGRDTFGNEGLKALLDESGLGDHPEVIRFFYKVGKANSEHDFANSGKPEKSKSFYDHPTSKK